MSKDFYSPGTQVFHTKMQIIGKVVKVEGDFVQVEVAATLPLQVWTKGDLASWNPRDEIQKKLKNGGYIREVFRKIKE